MALFRHAAVVVFMRFACWHQMTCPAHGWMTVVCTHTMGMPQLWTWRMLCLTVSQACACAADDPFACNGCACCRRAMQRRVPWACVLLLGCCLLNQMSRMWLLQSSCSLCCDRPCLLAGLDGPGARASRAAAAAPAAAGGVPGSDV